MVAQVIAGHSRLDGCRSRSRQVRRAGRCKEFGVGVRCSLRGLARGGGGLAGGGRLTCS